MCRVEQAVPLSCLPALDTLVCIAYSKLCGCWCDCVLVSKVTFMICSPAQLPRTLAHRICQAVHYVNSYFLLAALFYRECIWRSVRARTHTELWNLTWSFCMAWLLVWKRCVRMNPLWLTSYSYKGQRMKHFKTVPSYFLNVVAWNIPWQTKCLSTTVDFFDMSASVDKVLLLFCSVVYLPVAY